MLLKLKAGSRHVQFLEIAKNAFPQTHVIAGVTTDEDTIRVKGLTVIPAVERAQMVRGCRYVDEVIPNCEPVLTQDFMEMCRIDYFAHADTTEPDPYLFIKQQGKFLVIPRIPEWGSTTQIITRVIRNQDKYVLRQLQNGASLEDLNVSSFKLLWIKMKRWVR